MMDIDENLYIVSRPHAASNEVIFDTPVQVCRECNVVFVHKEHQEWRCPLGHPQG